MALTTKDLEALRAAAIGDVVTLDDRRVVKCVGDPVDECGNYGDWCDNCPLTHTNCALAEHCVETDCAFVLVSEANP